MNYPKQKFHMNIIYTNKKIINNCSICYDDLDILNQLKTSCNHIFCISCIKEYMINTSKKQNLECPYCRQIIFHIKLSNQEEINIMRTHFCKLTQTIEFMEPPPIHFQENYPYPLPHNIYIINNYLQEFLLEEEDHIIHYNILYGWICIIILILYCITYTCNILYQIINIYHEEYYLL